MDTVTDLTPPPPSGDGPLRPPEGPSPADIERLLAEANAELATLELQRDEMAFNSIASGDPAAVQALVDLDAKTAKVSARIATLNHGMAAARRRHADYEAQVRLSQQAHALITLDRNLARRLHHAARLEEAIGEAARQYRLLTACNERAITAFPGLLPPEGAALEAGGMHRLVAAELHRQGAGPHGDLGVDTRFSFPGAKVEGIEAREWCDRPGVMPRLTERLALANDYAREELRKLITSGAFDGRLTEPDAEPTDEGSI